MEVTVYEDRYGWYSASIHSTFFNIDQKFYGNNLEVIKQQIDDQLEKRYQMEKELKSIHLEALSSLQLNWPFYKTSFTLQSENVNLIDTNLHNILKNIKNIVLDTILWEKESSNIHPDEDYADQLTKEAIKKIKDIDNILHNIYIFTSPQKTENITIDMLEEFALLSEPISPPPIDALPPKPNKSDTKYIFNWNWLSNILGITKQRQKEVDVFFENDLNNWEIFKEKIETQQKDTSIYQEELKEFRNSKKEIKQIFDKVNHSSHEVLSNSATQESIELYFRAILEISPYPSFFKKDFELEYNPLNKVLIIEYALPKIEDIPTICEVKYIKSKDELKEYYLSNTKVTQIYEALLYSTPLRVIAEILQNDNTNLVESVSFNWWVNSINRATGKRENNCILSIQAKKEEFLEINLTNVDPKLCFKSLKWVWSSKLSGITPIQPILQINKNDKRFVSSYEVTNTIDTSTNLAAMDWEDFEHLVRELFEKEFSSNGWEVKVTQASKDWWVDAIAFDPDPIRWGKIVIQAKRYTNTVWVSAVRDLYGTVMNEWANKGILVSTADYWPDAYDFAKWKPLTLLNGANLLHLLEKHWHHCKIDMKEAKRVMYGK